MRLRIRRAVLGSMALVGAAGLVLTPTGPAQAARDIPAAPRLPTSPPTLAECRAAFGSICLNPQQLRTLYGVDTLIKEGITGKGVTIGIVDSFGSPTLRQDVAAFDRAFGLPPVDLEIVTPAGAPPAFDAKNQDMVGWAYETTMDVEAAHAIAPDAKIVVIATPVSETEGRQGFPEIINAEKAVLGQVDVISQSFAATEPTFVSPAEIRELSASVYPALKAAGIPVLSASGDSGPTDFNLDMTSLYDRPVTVWPASDPLVTAVGGTTLGVGSSGKRALPDKGWSGSGAGGGGRSEVFALPTFQSALVPGTGGRAVPDVSMVADPATGFLTYSSFSGPLWEPGGGTSLAAPILAAVVALAEQSAGARVGYLNDALYRLAATPDHGAVNGIVDVTRGSNELTSKRATVPGYRAVTGYDLATGLGTIDAARFVPALVSATKDQQRPLASAPVPTASPTPSVSLRYSGGYTPLPESITNTGSTSQSSHDVLYGVAGGLLAVVAAGGVGMFWRRRRTRPAAHRS
jgi:subtilase family serine protease